MLLPVISMDMCVSVWVDMCTVFLILYSINSRLALGKWLFI